VSTEDPRCATTRPIASNTCDVATEDKLRCGSGFLRTGCSEPLSCTPTKVCTCNTFDSGTWDCMIMAASQFCENGENPEGKGDSCLPFVAQELENAKEEEAVNTLVLNAGESVAENGNNADSCQFCQGQEYLDDPIIDFSSGNDRVSCAGLMDLVAAGMFADFCETERTYIEEACCRPLDDTSSSSNTNDNEPTIAALPISFYGLNYNTRKGPDWAADRERCKSRAEVVRDLRVLSGVTTRIRILSLVDCQQGSLVWSVLNDELSDVEMEVWLGLWVGPDEQVFVDEYNALAAILPDIKDDERLSGISVGSEAIYREDVSVGQAISNLDATRVLMEAYGLENVPVAIVDIAPIYSASQELRLASDTIMTNTFPFWEGISIDAAVNELDVDLGWLVNLPESVGKPFVLSETGWPSDGFLDGVGEASPSNQLRYLAESYCYLKQKGWAYYWFTAIDNDWRQEQDPDNTIEGTWGFLDANLELKDHFVDFEFDCGFDGSRYTFGSINWSVPELQEELDDEIDPSQASCGLWSGCEALAGNCCPTAGGDYLGCCRSEFFLGGSDTGNEPPPTLSPTRAPTKSPTGSPTKAATANPTRNPTKSPTSSPDAFATANPTQTPTKAPTAFPTKSPIAAATANPTRTPTRSPTKFPTDNPTRNPTASPTRTPTNPPEAPPTVSPTKTPPVESPPENNKNSVLSLTSPPTKSPTAPPAGDSEISNIEVANDEEDAAASTTSIFPWDDNEEEAPLSGATPSTNVGAAQAGATSGSGERIGTVWPTKLLVGAMIWSSLVGWFY